MDKELNRLQIQLMDDLTYAESILDAAKSLATYLKIGPQFFLDLSTTSTTLNEALHRISKNIEPKYIEPFTLAVKQIKMMALDLLEACKKNMSSA